MTITSEQQTGVTLGTGRADVIAGLRALADLLEYVPELPVDRYVNWAVDRSREGARAMDAAADALAAVQVPHEYSVREQGRSLFVELPGIRFSLHHMHDKAYAAYKARTSYESVVQVDTDQAEAVAR